MANYRFRYNPENLRYERLRISVWKVSITILGVISISLLLFVALLFLQNRFFHTPKKARLHSENLDLRNQKPLAYAQLDTIRQRLENLSKKEASLFARLFSSPREKATASSHAQLLSVNEREFQRSVTALQQKVAGLRAIAAYGNFHFGKTMHVLKSDVARLPYFPTILPVHNFEPHQLVSGFGTRINPWHKGSYQHDGIDLAQPRESVVIATAKGTVSLIKRSDLQAGYGNQIEIDHGNGFVTRYAHLGEIGVRQGQRVEQGVAIARMGMTGSSIAPHVHYELLWRGQPIDPLLLISEQVDANLLAALKEKSIQKNQALD